MPDKTKRQKRLDNGYCGQCGTNKITESPTCEICKEKARRYHKRRVVERKTQGMCTSCGKNKPILTTKTCQQCRDKHTEKWINNGERYKSNIKLSNQKLKRYIMDTYGGCCICCGEYDLRFLTIDHINNDGQEHRKQGVGCGGNIYRWLRNNGFPKGFQTLCYNCNIARYHNGGICPHKDINIGV